MVSVRKSCVSTSTKHWPTPAMPEAFANHLRKLKTPMHLLQRHPNAQAPFSLKRTKLPQKSRNNQLNHDRQPEGYYHQSVLWRIGTVTSNTPGVSRAIHGVRQCFVIGEIRASRLPPLANETLMGRREPRRPGAQLIP